MLRGTSGATAASRRSRNPRKISEFEKKRIEKQKNERNCRYAIYGLIAIAVITIFIFFASTLSPNDAQTTLPPFDPNDIHKAINEAKAKRPNAKESKISPPNIRIADANSVSMTFRLYKTSNCDESDPTQYITITKESTDVSSDSMGNDCPLCYAFCNKKFDENDANNMNERGLVKGIKILSNTISGQIDLYNDCGLNSYHSSIYDFEECVHIWDWPNTAGLKVRRNFLDFGQKLPPPIPKELLPPLQEHLVVDGISDESKALALSDEVPSYLIVYSCESSEYCAFQAQTNYYGFLTSGQHPKADFLRILTAQEPDDLASYIPTFTAPRNLYSRRYSPYNKADSMVKWFESKPNAPQQDIIVVIDPDNWIIRDISHWVVRAKKGHALGEAAWFEGSSLVDQLWKEVCLQNCDATLDKVGVPYIVHKDDLAQIAPYFKLYIDIMKEREEKDSSFLNKYKGIQMGWGTEMFGYIFGAAHAGIRHEVVHGIQRRDVSARPHDKKEELSIDMIHMGRAWWPKTYELSKAYEHTEGRAWSRFGTQVWCKCNYTASDIIPWPSPPRDQIDFQSYHTLYLLHHGREYFGELPKSKYRKPLKRYNEPYP